MKKSIVIILAGMLIMPAFVWPQGFLHRQEKKIVNGSGQEVLLKGIGLGGWLLQEGYMLQTADFANAQWQIRAKIADLIGETNTETFYETYRQNFVKKVDIDSIKSWGFNSIRLPFHYNLFATNTNPPVFLSKGFEIIDSLLSWCEADQIYLILDMHAAPGGQSDENISDYNPAYPSLWQSEANKNLTVQIWRKIAERYKDKEWIGGYDLINEPKWNLPPSNQPLRDLYIRLTDTIRAVDNNHILFIEGNWFATDFSGLTPAWDENMSYSFHKYWNANNQSAVQYLMDLRANGNRPLWLGETGENSNKWFTECVELMKNNNVGWAWWTLKKIEGISSLMSIPKIPAYQTLLNYWKGQGSRPTAEYAFNALLSQAEKLKLENCKYQNDVVDALFRQPYNVITKPYALNEIPGIVHATDYDLGKMYYAYSDVDAENTGSGFYNQGWAYRNDGVDIEPCNAFLSNGYNVGWIEQGEFLKYTINVTQGGTYNINFNVASANGGGKLYLTLDQQNLTPEISVPSTGGWQIWQYVTANNIYIPAGQHIMHAKFSAPGFNLSYFDFELIASDVQDQNSDKFSFNLEQNYPNPFNPSTTIKYSVPDEAYVNIKVYNSLGAEISELVNGIVGAGKHSVNFDAKSLSSQVLYCRINARSEQGSFTETRKMVLIK